MVTMTMQLNTSGLPRGELLGRYRSYEDAQKVVDHLAAAEDFDIKALSIVGNDLRSVEHIRSRLSYPKVAGAGAAQGAMFGFFIGLLIWLFAPEAPMANLLLSVAAGMAIWMIIGVISYAVRRGKRDFSSSSQLVATTFDVVCDFKVAARARALVPGAGVSSLNAANDPTGKSTQLQAEESTTTSKKPSTAPTGYETLPDGRPRYGVKLDQSQTVESSPEETAPETTVAEPESTEEELAPSQDEPAAEHSDSDESQNNEK